MSGSLVKMTGWRAGQKRAASEGKSSLGKVQGSQKGREASTRVKEQGTFWKPDKEFKGERVERQAGSDQRS